MRRRPADVLAAGLAGAVVSGFPRRSGRSSRAGIRPRAGGRSGGCCCRARSGRVVLLAAGAPVHLALSLGWAGVLGAVLPPRAEPLTRRARRARDRRARPGRARPLLPADPRAAAGAAVGRSRGVRAQRGSRAASHSASGPSACSSVLRLDDRAGRDELLGDADVVALRIASCGAVRPPSRGAGRIGARVEQERARARRRRPRRRAAAASPRASRRRRRGSPGRRARRRAACRRAARRGSRPPAGRSRASRGTASGRSPRAIAAIARSSASTLVSRAQRREQLRASRRAPRRTACW